MTQAKIVVYSSRYCPYCVRAKALLDSKSVRYEERVVDGNPSLRDKMEQLSGRYTVPQIWVGEIHVGGCDDLYALEKAGKLDVLLQGGHA